MSEQQKQETFRVNGEQLLAKVKEIIKEGNIRQITIKDKDDKTVMVLPLTVGVVGAVLLPTLAAIGTVAALMSECSIVVEKDVD